MKKNIIIILGIWLTSGFALASEFRIEAKGSYFSSENSIFRDVYGSMAKFGLEFGLGVAKNISIWAGLDHMNKIGWMTVSTEKTKVWITPLTLGIRYEIPAGEKLRFYVAAGAQDVFFKEWTPLGTVKENALGLIIKGGGMIRMINNVSAGLFLAWSTCTMSHEDVEFKVGGLDAGASIELRF